MGNAQRILPNYTYDDYVHWEGRWELIAGFPIEMSPAPLPKHQRIASALNIEFGIAMRKSNCKKCILYQPLDYKVAEDTVIQPDLIIVCNEIVKKFLDFPPILAVEILSPSTVLRDKRTKFNIYESAGVRYYIIVDIDKEIFEVYELKQGKYVLQENDLNEPVDFTLDEACTISVMLREIW